MVPFSVPAARALGPWPGFHLSRNTRNSPAATPAAAGGINTSLAAKLDAVFLGIGHRIRLDQRLDDLLVRLVIVGDQFELAGLGIPLRHRAIAVAAMVLAGHLEFRAEFRQAERGH